LPGEEGEGGGRREVGGPLSYEGGRKKIEGGWPIGARRLSPKKRKRTALCHVGGGERRDKKAKYTDRMAPLFLPYRAARSEGGEDVITMARRKNSIPSLSVRTPAGRGKGGEKKIHLRDQSFLLLHTTSAQEEKDTFNRKRI